MQGAYYWPGRICRAFPYNSYRTADRKRWIYFILAYYKQLIFCLFFLKKVFGIFVFYILFLASPIWHHKPTHCLYVALGLLPSLCWCGSWAMNNCLPLIVCSRNIGTSQWCGNVSNPKETKSLIEDLPCSSFEQKKTCKRNTFSRAKVNSSGFPFQEALKASPSLFSVILTES